MQSFTAVRATQQPRGTARPQGHPPPPANLPATRGSLLSLFVLATALAAAYYLAVRLGLRFRFQNSQIGVVWPANALVLGALLLTPRRRWWAVLMVVGVTHILAMQNVVPVWRWVWQLVTNGAFVAGTAALLLNYARWPLRLGNQRQVFIFILVVFATSLAFGFSTPSFVRSLIGLEVVGPFEAVLRTMMSNATAMLMITPVMVLWLQDHRRKPSEVSGRRLLEATALMLVLSAACVLSLASGPGLARNPSLVLLVCPPLLWAAVRFGPRGAATSLCFVSAISIWATAQRLGPFVLMADAHAVLSLQLFWLVLGVPVMLLAAVIHERERAEEELHDQRMQLAHVTRVNTVGTLSGALAHELGQPLTSILANAQAALRLLDQRPLNQSELRAALEDIAQQDRQAAEVIKHLRTMLKPDDGHFEHVLIPALMREALALGRSTIRLARVEVHARVAHDLPAVRGDAVQLVQVMLNLIINSCEAMETCALGERHLSLRAKHVDQLVEIVIADTGVGLPARSAEIVFEPFYTTKRNGLGLGLAISQSIVAAHGGSLRADNSGERGAAFYITLPVARSS